MAKISPFQGLRYSKELSREISRLVTPPYDIISAQEQKRFYRLHPKNIIRLEYGQCRAADGLECNQYTRARQTLEEWLENEVMKFEPKPALYLLRTEYLDPDGNTKLFTGLVARVKLENFGEGKIMPHEKTYEGPKADRYNLLKETGVSFSPVFSLYRDPSLKIHSLLGRAMGKPADVKLTDWSGSKHQMWVITQPGQISAFQDAFQGKKLLIADGHHRYHTALRYRGEFRAKVGESADWVMMCLAEIHDQGLSVLPVYRLVQGISQKQWGSYREKCQEFFEIEKVASVNELRAAQAEAARKWRNAVIGCIEPGKRGAYLLKVKPTGLDSLYNPTTTSHSRIYHRLDVVVLNLLILNRLLDIIPGEEKGRVCYTKNLLEARQAVDRGTAQAAFLPGLPNLDAIWDLAKQGETMPQKSTYFLPKLITGLVMNPVALETP